MNREKFLAGRGGDVVRIMIDGNGDLADDDTQENLKRLAKIRKRTMNEEKDKGKKQQIYLMTLEEMWKSDNNLGSVTLATLVRLETLYKSELKKSKTSRECKDSEERYIQYMETIFGLNHSIFES
jgi:hypothetical protein